MTASPLVQSHRAALRLGYAALLAFVFGAALVWITRDLAREHAAAALSAFAAVNVALLGGVHWGFGFAHAAAPVRLFAWGATTAIVASIAVLMPPSAGLVIHGVMLIGCYLADRKVYPGQDAAPWLTLRFRQSVVASLSCFIAAAGA